MRGYDKFKRKMNLRGGSLRDENIRNSVKLLENVFYDDASFTEDVYLWELGDDKDYSDRDYIPIRMFDRKFSAAQGWTVVFQTMIDNPVLCGDVVYDSKHDEYLICTEVYDINSVHWQGKFTLCNWILRWQDSNGDILEYPCYDMNTTQYNSGEQSNRQFTIGSTQHMITLPYDLNTVSLKTPQRFFLDRNFVHPTSFIVTQNDTTSYAYGKKGLVKVTVTECVNNSHTDRIDLGICDYIDNSEIKFDNVDTGNIVSKSVISYDTKVIKSGGDLQKFSAKFFDQYGLEVPGIMPRWNVICNFGEHLLVEQDDNYIMIGIDNDDYVDEDFKLILTDDRGNFLSTLLLRVESLL